MIRDIVLIGNPVAGGGALKKIKSASTILKKRGFGVSLMLTSQKGDAERFAKQISSEFRVKNSGLKESPATYQPSLLVIAAGGDGTYNEVANGLAFSDIPMAILPLGTTSVLAKELRIPSDIEKAIDIALKGKINVVNIGRITYLETDRYGLVSGHNTRYFLLMAGIGFDADAVLGVNEKMKKYAGKVAYIFSGFRALIKYSPSLITLRWQDKSDNLAGVDKGYVAIIGKGSCYGGNFKITPDAKLTEPCFYVFLGHKNKRFDLLRYLAGIVSGRHLKFNDVSYFKASIIEIEGDAHIQIDGDYLGRCPARIDVAMNALTVVARNEMI